MVLRVIKNNQIFKSSAIILLSSFFISIYNISQLTNYKISNFSLSHFIIYNYGYLNPLSIDSLIPVIIWIFPLLLLIYFLGDSIYDSIFNKSIYVFTRTDKRMKWFLKQSIKLFFNVFFFYVLYFFATILVGFINNLHVITLSDVLVILNIFLHHVFGSYILLLLITLFSFYIKIGYSYITVLSMYIFLLMITGIIYEYLPSYITVIKWLPTTQFLFIWHEDSLLNDFRNALFVNSLEGFDYIFSFIYYSIFLLLIMVFSLRKVNKIDIL